MQEPIQILQQYWGHQKFRSVQEEIIQTVLENRDCIALLPTGGGKSVCFQVPALARDGICIVVSPLIALMQDQVKTLKQKDIKAMALTGSIPFHELDAALDNCIYGNFKFLYLSPERLQQELVQERIRQMPVNLIAVDEAHCISQWGHDFRPAYRNIHLLREIQPTVPVIGLTATATKTVIKDIETQLGLKDIKLFQQSFFRNNLAYKVVLAEDKNRYLCDILKDKTAAAIVYVRSRHASVDFAKFLRQKKYTAEAFHGGLKNEEKQNILNRWMENTTAVIVATSAFGMGIDKPDVRNIVHLNLPESLESYFQEAGRAGRNGKYAAATIVTQSSDIPVLKKQFLSGIPGVQEVKLVYRKLTSYFQIAYGEGENITQNFNFAAFCGHYQLSAQKTYNALRLLDSCGILKLSEEVFKKTELQFLVSGAILRNFLQENIRYNEPVQAILRTYGGIIDHKTNIDLKSLQQKTGLKEQQILKLLSELQDREILDFSYNTHDASVHFLVPREDDTTINPFAGFIKKQQKNKERKINSVLGYIADDKICRSKHLLNYFGENLKEDCGICSVCAKNTSGLSREEMNTIYKKLEKLLQSGPKDSREICSKLPFSEVHILHVLQLLLDKNRIKLTSTNLYTLKK